MQHRGGKGVRGMSTHSDDVVEQIVYSKTHTDLLFFTSYGKVIELEVMKFLSIRKTAKGYQLLTY